MEMRVLALLRASSLFANNLWFSSSGLMTRSPKWWPF